MCYFSSGGCRNNSYWYPCSRYLFLLSLLSNACSSPAANQSRVHWYSKRNYQNSLLRPRGEIFVEIKSLLPSKPNLLYQWDISMVQLSPFQGDQERLGVSRSSYWIALLSFGQLDIGGLFIDGLKDHRQRIQILDYLRHLSESYKHLGGIPVLHSISI